jgi:hypothetical protein
MKKSIVERVHAHAAQADLDDVAVLSAVLHAIAHLKGSIEHDGDGGDEGGDQVAHGETDRERQTAADHGERRAVQAHAEPQHHARGDHVDYEVRDRLELLNQEPLAREAPPEPGGESAHDAQQQRGAEDDEQRQKHAAPADELHDLPEVGGVLRGGRRRQEGRACQEAHAEPAGLRSAAHGAENER